MESIMLDKPSGISGRHGSSLGRLLRLKASAANKTSIFFLRNLQNIRLIKNIIAHKFDNRWNNKFVMEYEKNVHTLII